jgi:adenosylcobalamin-dependent ribonucleoside-triphosphate reductase
MLHLSQLPASGPFDPDDTPWSTVGYLTYKRTYSRRLDDGDITSPTEEWSDTVNRVVTAANAQLKCGFAEDELHRLRYYMTKLKGTVAGRFLWQLGTPTIERLGLPSLQNCAFVAIDTPVRPFTWAMDMLMLGSGVGFSIQKEHVSKLPFVKKNFVGPTRHDSADADFIVPDTREGWVALLERTLESAFARKKSATFTYSTQLIRGKGAPIKGFGGVASGAEILYDGITNIAQILEKRTGKSMRSIDCLDIMNIIGSIVVAGNVRRSAQLAIGDPDDIEYLLAKRWDVGNIPPWRSMSNNSVACDDISQLHDFFWDGYEGKGEPYGLINLTLSKKVGRLGDTDYPDPTVVGYNPCAEQSLGNFETCCLAEIYLSNIETEAELNDVLRLLYRVNKHSLALGCHNKETEKIVNENMRMGIGVTGYLQASAKQKGWLSSAYTNLRQYDKEYSAAHKFPESVKLTTCKPSGTLSLLPGVTPGCHPGYAQYMIRRISMASNHSLVAVCRAHGYDIEYRLNFDGSNDYSTVVVSFPFSFPEGTVLAKDMTAIQQLKTVKEIQQNWSDNSVSCTVYYRKEELPEIKKYLARNYSDNHKSLSFLLHSDHGFLQAPYTEITQDEYDELVAKTTLINQITEANIGIDDDCVGGACPVR